MDAIRRSGLARWLLAAAAVAALAPSPAAADHDGGIGGVHYRPQVDVAPDGTATVAWEAVAADRHAIFVRRRSPAGTLGAKRQVSPVGVDAWDARLAVDGNGAATIVWRKVTGTGGVIQMRRLAADGTLGTILDLAPAGTPSRPDVAVGATGVVTAVWTDYDTALGKPVVRARQRAGVNPLRPLQTVGPYQDGDPQVTADPAGNATIAWLGWDSWFNVVKTRRLSGTGTFGAEATLTSAGANAFGVQVAAAPSGRATLAWVRSDGSNLRVESRWRDPDGTAGPVAALSAAGGDAFLPQLAGDQDGDMTFTWQRDNGVDVLAQTRSRVGGVLTAVQTLSAAGHDVSKPQVDVSPTGDARFTWNRFNGSFDVVQTRRRSAAGTLGVLTNASTTGSDAIEQQVAVDANGNAVLVWNRQGELHDPANPPHLQLRAVSAGGTVGATQNLE
ncbi:MAG TPA: hypothetical protein VF533_13555 [Solirubrobacteraceae bacterium]|jgi:hypothetical protein